jgi:hypothetical protein
LYPLNLFALIANAVLITISTAFAYLSKEYVCMSRLLLVACSATKNGAAETLPAITRYDGVAYRVIRRWQHEHAAQAEELAILILSARYGPDKRRDANL